MTEMSPANQARAAITALAAQPGDDEVLRRIVERLQADGHRFANPNDREDADA